MLGPSLYCEFLCFAEQHLCGTRPNDKFQTKIEDIMKIIEEKMERSECKYVSHGKITHLKCSRFTLTMDIQLDLQTTQRGVRNKTLKKERLWQ